MKLLASVLLWSLLTGSVHAALPPKVKLSDDPGPLEMSVAELLSLPSGNRLEVARARKEHFLKDLEVVAFDSKKDFADRWKAVVLYAQLAGGSAKSFLNRALKADEWFMRNAGILVYQEVLPQQAAVAARTLLTDKALVVRSAAIQVLENHVDPEVRELFWDEIDQPRNFRKKQGLWTRPQILNILARDPHPRELPLFMAYLREADPRMHEPAMTGLERITRQTLGKSDLQLQQKRELWLKWAKATEKAQRF